VPPAGNPIAVNKYHIKIPSIKVIIIIIIIIIIFHGAKSFLRS
jgi:hypothetical protein